jgi:hypothetical protein
MTRTNVLHHCFYAVERVLKQRLCRTQTWRAVVDELFKFLLPGAQPPQQERLRRRVALEADRPPVAVRRHVRVGARITRRRVRRSRSGWSKRADQPRRPRRSGTTSADSPRPLAGADHIERRRGDVPADLDERARVSRQQRDRIHRRARNAYFPRTDFDVEQARALARIEAAGLQRVQQRVGIDGCADCRARTGRGWKTGRCACGGLARSLARRRSGRPSAPLRSRESWALGRSVQHAADDSTATVNHAHGSMRMIVTTPSASIHL